jgi:Tfp pilus assembly protein PilF
LKQRIALLAFLALCACVTPARMHTQDELNAVTRECGLALGELIQDELEKKVLIAIRTDATVQQRVCVGRWARKNGLKPVFVNVQFPDS